MPFPKFHGITLAQNSWIENAHFERLTADPVATAAGRAWYNTTEKLFKFSTLDNAGTVIIRAFATAEALAAEVSTINAAITAEATARASADTALGARIDALGSAFNYVGTITAGSTTGTAFDMSTLTASQKNAGDYFKVTTAGYVKDSAAGTPFYVNSGDGLVWNLAGTLDKIDNTDSQVSGVTNFVTVTGSPDTGFTVDIAANFKSRVSTLETNLASEVTRATGVEGTLASLTTTAKTNLVAAVNEVDADLAAEVTRATGAEGTLSLLTTTAKTNLVAAINEVDADLTAEVTRAKGVEGTLTSLTTTAKTNLVAAINELVTSLASEVTRAKGAEGTLTSLTTTAKTNLVAAVNELDTDLAAEATARANADTAIKTAYNSRIYTYTSASAATTHTITHNLNSEYITYNIMVAGADNKFRNDIVPVEEIDNNSFRIDLSESRRVKVSVTSMASMT